MYRAEALIYIRAKADALPSCSKSKTKLSKSKPFHLGTKKKPNPLNFWEDWLDFEPEENNPDCIGVPCYGITKIRRFGVRATKNLVICRQQTSLVTSRVSAQNGSLAPDDRQSQSGFLRVGAIDAIKL